MPKKKIQLPDHYLCFNGDGTKAVAAAKADTLKAAKQYVGYFHAEEIPEDARKRAGLVYGVALQLNQKHKEILDSVEASLMVDVANHALFSDFQTIELWMNAHNIRQSAAAISRCRTLAEVIIPWCVENEVLPGCESQREVEQWFMGLNPEARSTVNRVGHVAPIIRKIAASEEMQTERKVEEVRNILGLVANPQVQNDELMLFARKYYHDKALGSYRLLADGSVEVTLRLEDVEQFEYLKDKRLKSYVSWSYEGEK
ncbi:MAG: hypothetical protein DPW09_33305 [Anaerolineae bacterium]|nr:hypothetical protein [Anaerolineales bacterium]MCQ3978330.1 hypothetical protein [Anaerolineae bacterium]